MKTVQYWKRCLRNCYKSRVIPTQHCRMTFLNEVMNIFPGFNRFRPASISMALDGMGLVRALYGSNMGKWVLYGLPVDVLAG